MKTYIVEPFKGIAPIQLGMTRDESRSAMQVTFHSFRRAFVSAADTDAYLGGCFQVFFDGSDHVEYIELSSGGPFIVFYDNIDVFGTKADKLIRQISQRASYDREDPELGYSYVFPTLELALWRPILPESSDDPEGQYFSTIGIGVKGYFSSRAAR